uniref:E3 ubiquitin-protein ligase TRIM36-like n=1 Tax=Crassostrea virginica TaxID=6565 RepID=A0A8B8BLU4_CRAVI|nr:E3 ubiquitin-protein ligase TRIM36-like [Crassostrea virginica]
MDPRYSGQDVVRCSLCKSALAPMYCSVCHTHLCKDCVEEHFSDKSKVHNVVPLQQFLYTPKCQDHPSKQCELHCKQCEVPICSQCIISKAHDKHEIVDVIENYRNKQEELKHDLRELEKIIFPRYQEVASSIQVQKGDLSRKSQKLKSALNNQREALQKEIDVIFKNMQSKIEELDCKYLSDIDKQEIDIKHAIDEITEVILDLKRLLEAGDVCFVSKYKSKNSTFGKLPPTIRVMYPTFHPQRVNREKLREQFGSLSDPPSEPKECSSGLQPLVTKQASHTDRQLLDVPLVISDIATGYVNQFCLACQSDEEIWTCGSTDIIKLFNIQGTLQKSLNTISKSWPEDLTMTQGNNLVYTDYNDQSLNIVKDTHIQPLIRLKGWRPRGVCGSSAGDLLVIMDSDDRKQAKIVRYSDSKEKQTIQWDDNGYPLYSSAHFKYLSENRNLDICVADSGAGKVVVVDAAGKLRFRYNGPYSTTKQSFTPRGITTDSQGRILIADYRNDRIHIVDQDGHYLRYIDNCGLHFPYGLCVDSRDNLYVAEWRDTSKVKKIQYIP